MFIIVVFISVPIIYYLFCCSRRGCGCNRRCGSCKGRCRRR
ncbi:MAG: hypothetical protein VB018_05465 [Lachnospiraceae bacterium]|nr:hypothetical protein [Lachnospiraceae bacterium]